MAHPSRAIYVEARIGCSIDRLWAFTQTPDLHRRWDLRFTDIEYYPRSNADQPQQFRYVTRLGFGHKIEGAGETVGSQIDSQGQRTSALKFWSDDPRSLIREGSGYWQYIPTADGARFITAYNYNVRYGRLGQAIDLLIFRPLLGWATAWSFDRLRLWLERGLDPSLAFRQSLMHAITRLILAFIFIYQGLVPKLVYHQADELQMLINSGVNQADLPTWLALIGWSEIGLGLLFIVRWRNRWPFVVTLLLMVATLLNVAMYSPVYLVAAFSPIALNVAVAALAFLGVLASIDLPSARRCLRKKTEVRRAVDL